MAANAGIIVGWNRAIPTREGEAVSKFSEYVGWLGKLQSSGQIESFEPVFTVPHGGDLNGFILIRGEAGKLGQLRDNEEWKNWETWGGFHLQNFGVVSCYLGDAVPAHLTRISKFIKR